MFKPYRGYLLVKPIKKEERKTESGFVVEKAEDKYLIEAEVVNIGEEPIENNSFLSWDLYNGNYVLFQNVSSIPYTMEGEDYYFVPVSDIVGFKL